MMDRAQAPRCSIGTTTLPQEGVRLLTPETRTI